MLQVFTGQNDRARAVLMVSGFKGTLICQALYPFWLGTSRQGLENVQAAPVGGSNVELRDGLYINTKPLAADASPSPVPVVIPNWNGDVYVLNGTGPGDNLTNAVDIQFMPC